MLVGNFHFIFCLEILNMDAAGKCTKVHFSGKSNHKAYWIEREKFRAKNDTADNFGCASEFFR